MRRISPQEIMAARDMPGGWTRARLEEWGVPWPAPTFWLAHLVRYGVPYLVVDDGSDTVAVSPFMSPDTRKKLAENKAAMERAK